MKSIPTVDNAMSTVTRRSSEGDFILPGTVTVNYACHAGYILSKPEHNRADCEYRHLAREGRPDGGKTELTSALWISTDKVRCQRGKLSIP